MREDTPRDLEETPRGVSVIMYTMNDFGSR